ncbi:hypothetical protein O2V63_11535 [Modestobacter sp. VKM Ac-2977]|uniref:hypothetical protein n=1 Tax=Modestobacter sp. VKM Ac-2977 TaxID=3004131 RepID=UPI0022AA97DC|nr:hypothetical protein [Modestobacter sp. VKM Ac-2977]MCZ2820963.1 hypothetical protein [Modestobacter sp. VKM Ac-2977]
MTLDPAPAAPAHAVGHGTPTVRRLLAAGVGWSVLHALLALRWLLDPGSWPGLDADERYGVLSLLDRTSTAWTLLVLSGAGLLLVRLSRRRDGSPLLVAAMAVQAAVLGGLAADLGSLVLLGYLAAIVGPVTFLAVFTVGAARDRRTRPWLIGVAALVAAGVAAGLLRPGTVTDLAGELGSGFAEHAMPHLHLALLLAGATIWGTTAMLLRRSATGRCAVCGRPAAAWTLPAAARRWGTVATWIAVAGPLPYALLRMTWLTPWPLGMPTDGVLEPQLRLFGLGLGFAALGGAVLTLGLIRPWGEVWPRWVPGLRGRPVPVRVPVLAGGVVAVALLAASPAFLAMAVEQLLAGDLGDAALVLVFPTLPWGLALAAAVTGYALRRRGTCATCGQGEPALSVRD